MANTISKVAILAAICIILTSAVWQSAIQACSPQAHYRLCLAWPYFYFAWIERYQTLIAALLALAGAWWAASAVYAQIQQSERAEQARLESKRAAARAVLPLALSAICEYAGDCVLMLQRLLEQCENQILPDTAQTGRTPEIPADVFNAMRDMTEAAKPHERDTLAALLETIQVQRSRISTIARSRRAPDRAVLAVNLEEFIVDAAEVYARASSLFLFSRRRAGDVPRSTVSVEEIEKALHILGIFEDDGPISERVKQKFNQESI